MLFELCDTSQVSMGTLTHLILRHLSGESSQVSRGTLTRLSLGHLSEQPYRSVWGTLSHPRVLIAT